MPFKLLTLKFITLYTQVILSIPEWHWAGTQLDACTRSRPYSMHSQPSIETTQASQSGTLYQIMCASNKQPPSLRTSKMGYPYILAFGSSLRMEDICQWIKHESLSIGNRCLWCDWMQKGLICTVTIWLHKKRSYLTPVARFEVLNDIQTARVERREQARQTNDLMLWNVTPVVNNYVVTVVLQYAGRFEKKHSINLIFIHYTKNKEVVCLNFLVCTQNTTNRWSW